MHSDPVSLGTATADASGHVAVTVTIPPGTSAGSHELLLTGKTSGITSTLPVLVSSSATVPTSSATVPTASPPAAPAAPAPPPAFPIYWIVALIGVLVIAVVLVGRRVLPSAKR